MESIGRLTVIGAGAMGTAFAGGVISAGLIKAQDVTMADIDKHMLAKASADLACAVSTDSVAAVRDAAVVMLAVKPAIVAVVLDQIGSVLHEGQLVISIAAGVKLEKIESGLTRHIGVVRAMPNTPCMIGSGAIGFSRGRAVSDEQAAAAKRIFDAVGISFEVPEKMLDAVTGLSGSGPAYVYVMIDAMSDAGVRVGLPRDVATKLAAQTVMGAARMAIESGEHPAKLKDQVTSPGGTTITALDVLEKAGFRSALIEAVKAATKRSEELA